MLKKPILILYKDLIQPLNTTRKSIMEMKEKIEQEEVEEVLLEAFVVFSISRFESMLYTIITYFLKKVPDKIDSKDIKLLKEEILSDEPLDLFIERKVNNIMYERIDEILSYFSLVLSIKLDIDKATLDEFYEFKESRNLLIHNASKVNMRYLDKCPNFKRASEVGSKITFEQSYVHKSILNILDIIANVEQKLKVKYSHYTEVRAYRALWNYIFSSPILKFDDYWDVDNIKDKLIMKTTEYEKAISSSEKMYLGIWRVHYNGNAELLKGFNMHTISEKNKMIFLLETLGDLYLGS